MSFIIKMFTKFIYVVYITNLFFSNLNL